MNNDMNNMLPSVLQTNATDENQSTMVESVIQEANSHNWVKQSFGKSRFVLQKKGTALAPNGTLIWKFKWSAYDASVDRTCSALKMDGGISAIENCRLYLGGKLISEVREVGQRVVLDNSFIPYDAQVEILDERVSSNRQFSITSAGHTQLCADKNQSQVGFRGINDTETANVECSVKLDQLFPVLKDTMLPSFLDGEIIVEIDWNGRFTECFNEIGDDDAAWTDILRDVEVIRPRLHLNYITMADEVANALKQDIMGPSGMTIPYREQVLIKTVLNAISSDDTSGSQDVELGFNNRSVMKLYIQKQSNLDNQLLRKTRSDGLLQEELQLVVNNRNIFDREVKKTSEMYSYLGQTAEKPSYLIAGSYGQIGRLGADVNAVQNTFSDTVELPCQTAATTKTIAGVCNNLQGRKRYLGINLGKVRNQDTPQNSMRIGESPMVLRINRNSSTTGDETLTNNSAESKGAYNMNIWVECVKVLMLKNGKVDSMNL